MFSIHSETRTVEQITACFNPLLKKLELILGALNLFNMHHLRKFELNLEDFATPWDEKSRIASGSFADVYQSTLNQNKLKALLKNATSR